MSRFIDLVETFDFSCLKFGTYRRKIDGLLERFPKYEDDDRFRTVLPHKSIRTADDFVSIKFCTVGRFPVFGIYTRRDFSLIAVVCDEDKIMYALDDCDLHASFVPDLKVRKLYLHIRDSHLSSRETPSYTKGFLRSAISTLSLGYSSEKNNEWCEAIVLLTGMTTQAVRFHEMKLHVGFGLGFRGAYHRKTYDGRYQLDNRYLGMQYRWNKFSKAIRRGECPFIYSIYSDYGDYSPKSMPRFATGQQVALVNDKNKTKGEIFKRRTNRWNGPLGNSKRKRKEQEAMMIIRSRYRNKEEFLKKISERVHGWWYGSVDTFTYEVSSVNSLPRSGQMVRVNRFLVPLLGCLPAVENLQNEGALLAFFRALRAAHRASPDCKQPVFSGEAFYLCAKQNKLKVDKIKQQSDLNSVSTFMQDLCFDHFGIPKEKIDPDKVKWNREPRLFVQPGCGSILGSLGATCVSLLQTRIQVQRSSATYASYSGVPLSRRSLQLHQEGLRGFYMTALNIWTKCLLIKK